jgi:hypothetical protein
MENNKPKSITNKIVTMDDVIAIINPSKEILNIINYKGKNKLRILLKEKTKMSLIAKAFSVKQ